MALAADGRKIYFQVSIRSLDVRYQKHEICAIPLVNTVGGCLSSYIDGYANDPLEIKLVVCGDNFGLNIFISYYNYTSTQIYMKIIQAMGLERKLKAYKVLLPGQF